MPPVDSEKPTNMDQLRKGQNCRAGNQLFFLWLRNFSHAAASGQGVGKVPAGYAAIRPRGKHRDLKIYSKFIGAALETGPTAHRTGCESVEKGEIEPAWTIFAVTLAAH
jgi:hypothetical protein